MGWAVGTLNGRHIGYGVPAMCDQPGCGKEIDRGLAYACGGGVCEDLPNCGLFFCSDHLFYSETESDQGWVCARCAKGETPFNPTPDVDEWVDHVLTDQSWEQFRAENPAWAGAGR